MGQEAATAQSDRSTSFTRTETEGHTAEITGLTTLTWSSAFGTHSLTDMTLVLPKAQDTFRSSEHHLHRQSGHPTKRI